MSYIFGKFDRALARALNRLSIDPTIMEKSRDELSWDRIQKRANVNASVGLLVVENQIKDLGMTQDEIDQY